MSAHGVLEITTHAGCRINCRFCPQATLARSFSDVRKMSFSMFVRCVERLPLDVRVHFSGMSEPWLNEQCTDMLLYASRRGHVISVYTTLAGMTAADFERMCHAQFDYFVLHLPDREGNSKIPVTPVYLSLLERVLGADLNVLSARQISCHGTLRRDVADVLRDRYPVYNTMIDRAGNLGEGVSVPAPLKGPVMCGRAGRRLNRNVLLPDGSVTLCCMDYGMQHVLGNLSDSSYEDVLHGPEMTRVLAAMDNESRPLLCRKCNVAVRWQQAR